MERKLDRRLLLITLKYSPWIIAITYFIEVLLSCFMIQSKILLFLFGSSVFPLIVILLFSFSLNYCIWHRLPIYYTLVSNIVNLIDFYIGIPITNKWMLILYLIIAGIFVLIGSYIKNRENVKKRNITKGIT